MKHHFQAKYYALTATLILLILAAPFTVWADAMVGMECPDYVSRGESFKVLISADGATAGVEGVQLYLIYDVNMFQFVKANSVLLETAGSEIADSDQPQPRLIKDDGGIITLLAFQTPYTPPSNLIAELEFVCKVDAPIGPASIHYKEGSFVVIGGSKVHATTEKLNFELIDPNLEGQENPIPPQEMTAAPSVQETIEVPFDPANQIGPVDSAENVDPAEYGIGSLNEVTEETTRAQNTQASEKPTPPPTHPNSESPAQSTESPLRSVSGEILTVPPEGLTPDKIPEGFKGDSENILGVNVPVARDAEKPLTLYWLKASATPNFYTYDPGIQRFSLYEQTKPAASTTTAATSKSTFTAQRDKANWQILLLSVLAVSSLGVLLYTLNRNLKAR